jgi:large subunit ribosomal protein L6
MQGKKRVLSLGYSHPVEYEAPKGIDIVVENPIKFVVKGIDKQVVGETCAIIRGYRPPEPYHGKGIRYSNENVVRKAGKTGAK